MWQFWTHGLLDWLLFDQEERASSFLFAIFVALLLIRLMILGVVIVLLIMLRSLIMRHTEVIAASRFQ